MKLYRRVLCKDRLPEPGIYHVIGTEQPDGSRMYESDMFEDGEWEDGYMEVEYWLEEIEITLDQLNNLIQPHAITLEHGEKCAQDIYDYLKGKE